MPKIIQVITSMMSCKEKISSVSRNNDEFFFLYNNKFKWSITKSFENTYSLYFYPSDKNTIEQLSNRNDWSNNSHLISYSSKNFNTDKAIKAFEELYEIVSNKLYGLDDIFAEIINDYKINH